MNKRIKLMIVVRSPGAIELEGVVKEIDKKPYVLDKKFDF